LTWKQQDRRR